MAYGDERERDGLTPMPGETPRTGGNPQGISDSVATPPNGGAQTDAQGANGANGTGTGASLAPTETATGGILSRLANAPALATPNAPTMATLTPNAPTATQGTAQRTAQAPFSPAPNQGLVQSYFDKLTGKTPQDTARTEQYRQMFEAARRGASRNPADGYNAQGSPYWGLKTFWILALPEEHPFWQAEEKEYMPPERCLDEQVRLLLTRDPENRQVVAYTAGNHAWEHMHEDEKYEKFAYSTQFAFSVAKEDSALNRGAYDSMLAVRAEGRDLWHVRSGCEQYRLAEDRVSFTWSPMNGVTIDTVIAPKGMWHVRKHVIHTTVTLEAAEGAFSIPRDWAGTRPCDRVCTRTEADESRAAAAGERGTSVICALKGYTGGEVIATEPNTNLMEPRCVLPTLHSRLEPGEHILLCAVYTDSGNNLPDRIPEEVKKLAGSL